MTSLSLLLAATNKATNCGGLTTRFITIDCHGGNPIYALVGFIVDWVTGILGALAVIVIIVAGIQYITSQGSPDALKSAKERLTNAIVGVILLALFRVILVFLGVAK